MILYNLDILLSRFETSLLFTSSYNCCSLICIQISEEAGKVIWYSHLFKNFPWFVAIYTVKDFGVVNKAVAVFSGTLSLFLWSNTYFHPAYLTYMHYFLANRWGNNGNSDRLYFFGLQNHCRWCVLCNSGQGCCPSWSSQILRQSQPSILCIFKHFLNIMLYDLIVCYLFVYHHPV